jgi:uncharacterized membrane protein YqjE
MPEQPSSEMARAIQDVTERAQLLVREEVALAKAEMTEKVTKLIKGAVFGIVAGVFAVFALIYLLHALSWGIWDLIGGEDNFWVGFLITGVVILIVGTIAGLLASHAADGDRGGQADQGHADRRPGGDAEGCRRGPPGAGGGVALMAETRTAEEIRRSIEANRTELGLAVERLRAEVAEVTDWRKQLNTHRKQVLIGAAVAGFVLGGGIAALTGLVSGGDRD